jgi:formylglycine-generating enzyme required for sulfatase activity
VALAGTLLARARPAVRKRILKGSILVLGIPMMLLLVFRPFEKRLPPLPSTLDAASAASSGAPAARTPRRDARGVEQVWVPAGCFRRGSDPARDPAAHGYETPQHDVCFREGFWIDKYEVTHAAYERFIAAGGYTRRELWSVEGWAWKGDRQRPEDPPGFAGPRQPRVWISYYEAEAYARWRGGRPPTEAEWEYAARGPKSSRYPWGEEWDRHRANVQESGIGKTVNVDEYASGRSWCGAYNMAGNAWEWIADWYDAGIYRRAVRMDPPGPAAGTERVIRGGSYASPPTSARSARRSHPAPSHRSTSMGLRVVSDPETRERSEE